jgi:hypothetical protein
LITIRRKRLFWLSGVLFALGVSFLIFPPYKIYCSSNQANDYYCAAYGVTVALGQFVDEHAGAVAAVATIFIGLFTYTLYSATRTLWLATLRSGVRQSRDMKDGVTETRRIGEAQVRAYVSIKWCGLAFWDPVGVPIVRFVAFNTGQSPAKNFIWNVTVQYLSGTKKQTSAPASPGERGIDIPATTDSPIRQIPVQNFRLKDFRETLDPEIRTVVNIRIGFSFTDVFEIENVGEYYFVGIAPESAAQPTTPIGFPKTMEILHSMAKPEDWDI